MDIQICKIGLDPFSNMGVAGSHSLKPYFDLSPETITVRKLKLSEYLLCYMEIKFVNLVLTPFQYGRGRVSLPGPQTLF